MFNHSTRPKTKLAVALSMLELIFHAIVRSIRSQHNNAYMALGVNLLQTLTMLAVFYVMYSLLGMRNALIRGDFLLFLVSGIFVFMTHVQAFSKVAGAAGANSSIMKHSPMNTMVSIVSAALGALYIQVLSLLMVLYGYHAIVKPLDIYDIKGAGMMVILAWFSGVGLGIMMFALKPWAPAVIPILNQLYMRVNMIASGKMFLVNSLPGFMIAMFDWNPLFHIVDQSRGFTFINYTPQHTSWQYPFWAAIVFIFLGFLAEHYTRQRVSISWGARH